MSEIEREPDRARDELLIAAAGPFVSVVIAGGAWVAGTGLAPDTVPGVLVALLAWSNVVLAAFNLLPGLPLDGGRLLKGTIWAFGASPVTGTRIAAWTGRAVAVAVAVFGLLVNRTSPGFGAGVLSVALAAYLWVGATQALKAADLLTRLPAVDVASLVRPGLLVAPDLSVDEALHRAWAGNARGLVVAGGDAPFSAIVDERLIGAVPPERRPWTQVAEVARPLEPGLLLPVGLDARTLLERMQALPAREYLVVSPDGTPAGIIATADFVRRLRGAAP